MGIVWSAFAANHERWENFDTQRFWSDTQFDYEPNNVTSVVAALTAGDFTEIEPSVNGTYYVRRPDTSSGALDIIDWNDRSAWDPNTQQFIHAGARRKSKIVAYANRTGRWREVPQPASDLHGTAHWYGRTAWNGSLAMFGRWTYDPATDTFVDFWTEKGWSFDRESTLEWWPEYGTSGGWFAANNGVPKIWDVALDANVDLADTGHGQHVFCRRLPATGQMILHGGSDTVRRTTVIETDGNFAQVSNSPVDFSVSEQALYAHPTQACWIRPKSVFSNTPLLTYWPATDTWQEETETDPSWASGGVPTHPVYALDSANDAYVVLNDDGLYGYKPATFTPPAGGTTVGPGTLQNLGNQFSPRAANRLNGWLQ